MVCISAGTFGDLENQGRVHFFCRFGNPLNDFHVVHIKSANGVAALVCFFEHFFG